MLHQTHDVVPPPLFRMYFALLVFGVFPSGHAHVSVESPADGNVVEIHIAENESETLQVSLKDGRLIAEGHFSDMR